MKKNKKLRLIFLCMLVAIVAGGCGKNDSIKEQETTTENVNTTDTAEPVDTADNAESGYKEILDKYYVAMSERWDTERAEADSINSMCVYAGGEDYLADTGYYISDIDGNGIQELFIGFTSDDPSVSNTIFEIYTLVDGKSESIATGWGRNTYFLRSDNKIGNASSSGAAYSDFYVLEIGKDGKTLEVVEGVRTDTPNTDDYNIKWYKTTDMDYDWTNDTEISEDEGNTLMQEYSEMYVSIPFTPFSEYQYSE